MSASIWYEVDVTSQVTGDGTYSLRISSTSTNSADYSSKEGTNSPELVLTLGGTPPPTNTPTPGPSPMPTRTPTPSATPVATNTSTPGPFSSATFVYDGDGKRVKSIFNGTTSTYFVGNYYEVTGSTITKYYGVYGAQRIATLAPHCVRCSAGVRTNGTLNYLLGDHLGSTGLVTDATGYNPIETRYKAWGETRYASGTTPTKYHYTGQYSYASDFGLHFYNARWYDPSLGRFAQADTIIPGGVQGLDRFAYVNNSPINYSDPSGNIPIDCFDGTYCGKPKLPEPVGNNSSGNEPRIIETDTDQDGIPNMPDSSYPAIQMGRGVQEDCLPGNLVECFYNQGVMPSGDYDITYEEYFALMLAIGYDIDNQGPIENYEIRGIYDTPFFNLLGQVEGTICIEGGQCRDRSEYNYIAQGAWSAAALEGREGMLAVVAGWKWHEYKHLPTFNAVISANTGYDFYATTHPIKAQAMFYGFKNYASGLIALIKNW